MSVFVPSMPKRPGVHAVRPLVDLHHIAEAFVVRATVIFKQIQGHSVTVSMQREHLKNLLLFYIECVVALGPFLADDGEADTLDLNEWHVSTSKTFDACLVEVKSFIDDQGSFASDIIASMDDGKVRNVVKSVATLLNNAINGIIEIVAKRDPNPRGANS